MVEVELAAGKPPASGVLVLPVAPGQLSDAAQQFDVATDGLLRRALGRERDGAKHGRVISLSFPPGTGLDAIVLLVVGKPEGVSPLDLEELGGNLVERLSALRIAQAAVASSAGLDLGLAPAAVTAHLAHGSRLRGYEFDRYRSKPADEDAPVRLTRLVFHEDETVQALRLLSLADAVNAARDDE